nr:hypothetical protein [Tanacetum cinerariifolium]
MRSIISKILVNVPLLNLCTNSALSLPFRSGFIQTAWKERKGPEKSLVIKSGVARSFPGSFPQRGLNGQGCWGFVAGIVGCRGESCKWREIEKGRFLGMAGNTVQCIVFQNVRDRDSSTILEFTLLVPVVN